jgi:DNA-binding FadR family transcriptional regulator
MSETGSGDRRLYQQVSEKIAALIAAGEFAIGQRLPPERDLASRLNVSRPTVREALVALEIAGLVEVRTGSGTYVCRKAQEADAGKARAKVEAGPSAFELITARRMIEPAVAGEAAAKATKKDLAAIAKAFELCEEKWQAPHHVMLDADRQFHVRIAEACHNEMIAKIVNDLWEDMFSPIFAVLSARTRLRNKKMLTLQDHRTLMSCIERHDVAGAEAAMLTHLVHAEIKLLQSELTAEETFMCSGKGSGRRLLPAAMAGKATNA